MNDEYNTEPEGFMVIDFSRFTDTLTDENGVPVITQEFDWNDALRELPEEPVEEDKPVDLRFEKDVLAAIRHMDIVQEARDRRDLRDRDPFEPQPIYDFTDLLQMEFEPVKYRIEDLWQEGGNVLFAAPAKFGKSTVMMNLIRVLQDGGQFLDNFRCAPRKEDEAILLVDLEMSENRVVDELRAQGIRNGKGLKIVSLRGKAKDFDITNPEVRAHYVSYCKKHNVKTLILDPLAPLLGYLSIDENDNTMVNRFFQQLDEFKAEAGIRDMIVVHHCGHSADWRPRGASRFNDWPDALWLAKINGPVNDPQSPREFFVRGRDVGQTLNGEGTIKQDPLNPKRLYFDSQSSSSALLDAAIQGMIENLICGTVANKLCRWDLDQGNKLAEVVDSIYQLMISGAPDVTANKIESVIDRMANDGISIHKHKFNPAGVAGRTPWRIYPADRCPHD